jgi:hypothetical protein
MRIVLTKKEPRTPRMSSDDVVPPPSSVTVDYDPKPVLWMPNGLALVRRPGF